MTIAGTDRHAIVGDLGPARVTGNEVDGVPVGHQLRDRVKRHLADRLSDHLDGCIGWLDGRPREVGLLARHGVADHAVAGLERPFSLLSGGAPIPQAELGVEQGQLIGVPVRRRQLHPAAVHGASALDDAVEVGQHEVHADRDLDLALFGHRANCRRIGPTSGTRPDRIHSRR